MAQWIGYMVSIKCTEDLGTYQGEISSATNSFIILIKAFCNGIPCNTNEVKISAEDIVELKLIDKHQSGSPQQHSTITIAKPIAKRVGRTQSTSELSNSFKYVSSSSGSQIKSKPIDIENKTTCGDPHNFKNATPNKKDKNAKGKWLKGWKDEECFGSPLDDNIAQDFDFEKNLALFNKQAMWDKLNNAHKPDIVKHAESKRTNKYRHDENVIASKPTTYRQITVPRQDFCEYVTDDGLIIPSISRSLRKKLWDACDKVGLNWDKRVELMGRAATELSLQLLGGAHRFSPNNSHQLPTVVVFCGPHKQGAMAINAARQLASHNVNTIVYIISSEASVIKKELSLYLLTKNQTVRSSSELPNIADLIIVALCEDTDNPKTYSDLAHWAGKNRAPVLALDPPSIGTPGFSPKFSLLPVLPLPHAPTNGKLYLCNLGIPVDVFSEVGITYKSPFGPKFVIPLHPKED